MKITDICNLTGISRFTFYKYFRGSEKIHNSIIFMNNNIKLIISY
ncbi:helix-turn-helix domain-containing protein [Clostridium puniceum]